MACGFSWRLIGKQRFNGTAFSHESPACKDFGVSGSVMSDQNIIVQTTVFSVIFPILKNMK